MNYKIVIEGQEIPVPDEIGSSDEAVKRAMTPFYPQVANAMITRVEKGDETTITVVKKAGSKGNCRPLDILRDVPEQKNAVIALFDEMHGKVETDPYELLVLEERIGSAIELGDNQAQAVKFAKQRLIDSRPVPSRTVPRGF